MKLTVFLPGSLSCQKSWFYLKPEKKKTPQKPTNQTKKIIIKKKPKQKPHTSKTKQKTKTNKQKKLPTKQKNPPSHNGSGNFPVAAQKLKVWVKTVKQKNLEKDGL